MICPKCGTQITDESSLFCPNCGYDLRKAAEKTAQAEEKPAAEEQAKAAEPVQEAAAEAQQQPKQEEPKEKKESVVGKYFLDTLKYMGYTVCHPSKSTLPSLPIISLIADLYLWIINFFVLYLVQNSLVSWIRGGMKGLPDKMFHVTPVTTNMSVSIWRTIASSLAVTAGILAVTTVLLMVVRANKKEKVKALTCLKAATHQMILPAAMMLVASLVISYSTIGGLWAIAIVFVIWFMNIILLFREKYNWLSYLTTAASVLFVLWLIAVMLQYSMQ